MDDFEKFYNLALRFLSYRPRSEKEVRDKLKSKKVESSTIEIIISKLIEKKFINDEEFAKGFVESRLRFKPRSVRLIKLELKQKGIEQELIDKMINDEARLPDGQGLMINDLENAKKLIEKKLPRYKGLPKQKIYEKVSRFLASKGFGWDTIKKSIDEAFKKGV